MNIQSIVQKASITSTLVPTVIESTNKGERAYDIYSRLLKDRIIVIHDQIGFGFAGLIIAQLLFLEKEDPKKDIYMYVNSPGGSVSEGLAIFDVMNNIACDVVTIGMGMCASMGAFLLAGGTKGKRYVLPNTEVMIHQPLMQDGPGGQATDIEITAKQILKTKEQLIKYFVQFTGQPEKKIRSEMERDFWMNAEEAKKYGIVDKVVESSKKQTAWKPVMV
jgi:ATP-dependent Clp protease, protease subunit